ncbi:MAG: protein phosphatase CheZ [Alphaproteobacteria bacterium]|nr:protein phosphatase CheZ [Alphaproteobacteria bacterium]
MSGTARVSLTDEEYYDIEDALASTARGRAFLRARDQRLRVVAVDEVRRLTISVRDWTSSRIEKAGGEAHMQVLRRELQEMASYIQKSRGEIAAMRLKDDTADASGNSRIHFSMGELDAIVTSTERATSDILNASERIFSLASDMPTELEHVSAEITTLATDIMTACSFQDLTGQRINKVVNTLRYLEQRVAAMVEIWGVDENTKPTAAPSMDMRPDAHLLNGPARPGEGHSQAEIDALLGASAAAAVNGPEAQPPAAPTSIAHLNGAESPAAPTISQAAPPVPAPAAPAAPAAPKAAAPAPKAASSAQADIDKLFA